MNLFRTVMEFVVKDRGTAALGRMTQATERAGLAAYSAQGNFKALAGAFTSLVVASKIRSALQAVIDPARKMEQAIARLAFTSGRTRKEIDMMRMNAEKVAEITVFGPQEAMDATVQLNRVLRGTNETMLATRVAAKLAQASFGKMTLEKSTQMVAEMAKAFGMSAGEIKVAGDKIFAMSQTAGIGVENFAGIMGRLGTAATLGGQSFNDVLKAFAVSSRLLTSPLQASNLMLTMFTKLTSEKTQEALRAIGVEATDASGRLRPIGSIMKDLATSASIHAVETRDRLVEAFGMRSLRPMVAMLGAMQQGMRVFNKELGKEEFISGPQVFERMGAAAQNTGGALDKGVAAAMQNADAQMRRLEEAWTRFKTSIGSLLLEAIFPLAKALATVVGGISNLINTLGPIGRMLLRAVVVTTAFTAAWAALRWTLGGMRDILKAVGSRIGLFTDETTKNTRAAKLNKIAQMELTDAQRVQVDKLRMGRIGYRLHALDNKLLAIQAKHTAAAYAASSMSVGKFNSTLSLSRLQLAATTIGLTGLRAGVRGLKMAFTGLGTAIKAVFGGVLLAFLPEIWEGFEKLVSYTKNWALELAKTEQGIRKLAAFEQLPIIGYFVQTMREWAIADKKFKALMEVYDLQIEKEALMRKKSAEVASEALLLGTKGFERTVNKLEGLVKAKPKAIKLKDVVTAQDWLKKVIATPIGKHAIAPSGVAVRVTEEEKHLAQRGLTMSQAAMRTIMNASKTGTAMTGKVAAKTMEGLTMLDVAVKGTVDPLSKDLLKAAASPALAAIHQMKAPQVALRTYQSAITGRRPETAPGWLFGGLGEKGSIGDYMNKLIRRGAIEGAPPKAGGFATERALKITEESPYERFKRTWDENKKQLEAIDAKMKKLSDAADKLGRVGIKIESMKDPGGFPPYYLQPRR